MFQGKTKVALAALLALAPAGSCWGGGVVTDGTLGKATSLVGPNFAITSDLGKQVGPNLFHSFNTFNLSKGEVATFSGPGSVSNVIARVTGGSSSSIDGTLQCTIPQAHFYLVNPAGVVFGPNAQLDVKGSFIVTTADYLKLADGGRFNATHVSDTTLTSAAPAAFGFLAASPAGISVNGSKLSVPAGETVSLVGGAVQIVNGTIQAPGGRVNLVAAASNGEVAFDPVLLSANIDLTPGGTVLGDVSMTSSNIVTSGPGGGRVSVRANSFEMNAAAIFAINTGATDGLGVDIMLTGNASIAASGIATNSTGAGRGGPVNITAAGIMIDGTGLPALATGIETTASGPGRGGDIHIQTGSMSIVAGGTLFAGSGAAGDSGTININASGDIHVDGTATILAPAFFAGRAGDITVSAGSLELTHGALISAATNGAGNALIAGNAGNITINAGSIAIDNTGATRSNSGIIASSFSTGAGGNAGQIVINTNSLSVTQGAAISASTNGPGAAGSVTVAGGSITLDGGTSPFFTGLFAASFNPTGAPAGSIAVSGTRLQVLGGAVVTTDSFAIGAAGNTNVNVTDLTIDGRSLPTAPFVGTGIFARSRSTSSSQLSGQVTVQANTITILAGGEITADSFDGSNAGAVSVTANQSLALDGRGAGLFTGLSADSGQGAGSSGRIQVAAGNLSVVGGATIEARPLDSGAAGTVSINVKQLLTLDGQNHAGTGILANNIDGQGGTVQITGGDLAVMGGAQVGASSFGAGNAGSVTINARDISMQGVAGMTTLIVSGAFGTGNAGTVNITANSLTLTGSTQVSAANSGPGAGGTVNVTAAGLTLTGGSGNFASIDALTTGSGNAGTVNVQAGTMQVLNGGRVNASNQGTGIGGTVNVTATSVTLDAAGNPKFTGLLAESILSTGGAAGTVSVHAGSLVVTNDAVIDTTTFGAGAAGGIQVNANSIVLSNGGSFTSNGQGSGPAGSIATHAGSLQILNGSQITSDTFSTGAGGSVSVSVTGALVVDGQTFTGPSATGITATSNGGGGGGNAGNVSVQAGSITLRNKGAIESNSESGTGSAGTVTVTANAISVKADSDITSATFGAGAGGDVTVTGRQIVLNGASAKTFTGITAQTNGAGNAGAVRISADSLQLLNDAEISSSTFAGGAGGKVFISANDLTMRRKAFIDSASLKSGPAGTIGIHVSDALTLSDSSSITCRSLHVSGGGIEIFAGNTIQLRGSRITARAVGEGGTVDIQCPGVIDLLNSNFLTNAGKSGNGGNMTVDPSFVILENSHLSANGGINGGNITINPDFFLESHSTITATGATGVSGMLQITPDYNFTGALLSLPVSLSDNLRLEPQCAADLPGAVSSFIVTGRGGEPLTPGGFSPTLELRIPVRIEARK